MGIFVQKTGEFLTKWRDSKFWAKYRTILIWGLIIIFSISQRLSRNDLAKLNDEMIASAMLTTGNMTNWIRIDRLKIDKLNYQVSVLYLNSEGIPEIWRGTYYRNIHLFVNQTVLNYAENNENEVKKAYCLSAYENFDKLTKKMKSGIGWAFPDNHIIQFCGSYSS